VVVTDEAVKLTCWPAAVPGSWPKVIA